MVRQCFRQCVRQGGSKLGDSETECNNNCVIKYLKVHNEVGQLSQKIQPAAKSH